MPPGQFSPVGFRDEGDPPRPPHPLLPPRWHASPSPPLLVETHPSSSLPKLAFPRPRGPASTRRGSLLPPFTRNNRELSWIIPVPEAYIGSACPRQLDLEKRRGSLLLRLTISLRSVRCPKCHSLLQEPAAPVYQCGGCGATLLRGKNPSPDRNDDAERNAVPPAVVRVNNLPRATRDDELPDASSTIIEATRSSARGEPAAAPKSAAESKPSRRDAAAGGGKVRRSVDDAATPTPPAASRKKAEQDLEKILNTVHALKGDLFTKSPGLDPTERPRPHRLPMRQGGHHASRPVKHGHQVAAAAPPRGLPSRRYRRCRADLPCCDNNAKRASCGCCGHHHHHTNNLYCQGLQIIS
jgi:hypothetical protein